MNGRFESGCQMVRYINGVLKTGYNPVLFFPRRAGAHEQRASSPPLIKFTRSRRVRLARRGTKRRDISRMPALFKHIPKRGIQILHGALGRRPRPQRD